VRACRGRKQPQAWITGEAPRTLPALLRVRSFRRQSRQRWSIRSIPNDPLCFRFSVRTGRSQPFCVQPHLFLAVLSDTEGGLVGSATKSMTWECLATNWPMNGYHFPKRCDLIACRASNAASFTPIINLREPHSTESGIWGCQAPSRQTCKEAQLP
jgi:hypothetical protein